MSASTDQQRIPLTDAERAFARRRPDKTLYLGVVRFRGPRGRKYRPVRTKALLNLDLAMEAVTDIRQRQYAHGAFPTGHSLYRVDHLGRVQEEVEA